MMRSLLIFVVTALCAAWSPDLPAQTTEAGTAGGAEDQAVDSADAWYARSVEAFEAGDHDNAIEHISEAQRLAPEEGTYIWHRVLILEAMSEPTMALNVIESQRELIEAAISPDEINVVEERLIVAEEAAIADSAVSDPVVGAPPTLEHATAESPAPTPVAGLLLAGTGATFLAAAPTLFLVAYGEERRVRCTTGERTDCTGIEPIDELDAFERDRRLGRVDSLRVAGWTSAGVGVGLLGWGLLKLIMLPTSPAEEESGALSMDPKVGPDFVGAHLRWTL
jgi:hypothetical protein